MDPIGLIFWAGAIIFILALDGVFRASIGGDE